MVAKQFLIVAAEYLARKLLTHIQRRKVEKLFKAKREKIHTDDLVAIEDLALH